MKGDGQSKKLVEIQEQMSQKLKGKATKLHEQN